MAGSATAGRGANASLLAGLKGGGAYTPAGTSGLLYRIRANSLAGLANGSSIASVSADGGNLTLAQGTATAQPIFVQNGLNGNSAMRFDGSDDFLSGSVTTVATPLTFVVIMNLRSLATDQQIFYAGGPELLTSNTATNWQLYDSASGINGGTPSVGSQVLIASYPSSGSAALYVNGTSAVSGTIGSIGMSTFTLGCRAAGNKHLKADIYEVLIYSGSLTALDRSRIDSYAQLTYGISVIDYRAPVADAPGLINGMTARYRADQITGVTNGSPITSWPDASGSFYDATQATAANQPTYVSNVLNGQPAVRFVGTSSQYLASQAPSGDANQTIIAVTSLSSSASSGTATVRSSLATGGLQYRFVSAKPALVKAGITNIGSANFTVSTDTFVASVATYSSSAGNYTFRTNGSANGASTNVQTLTSGSTIIGYNPVAGGEYFWGDMAEIICYNRILNPSELRLIESYIQDRYAIAVADYYIDDAINKIGGIAARYRADKIVGVADGGIVSSWPDCSSNNVPAVQATSAAQPTLALGAMNGQPVIRFNGTSQFLATAAASWGPYYTAFVVHKYSAFAASTGPIGNDYSTTVGGSSQRVFYLSYASSTQLSGTTYYGNAATTVSDSVSASTGSAAVASLTRSAGGVEVTFNGTTDGITTSVTTPTSTSNARLTIGALTPSSGFFGGDIAEVIVFNRDLSTTERAAVHNYIASRYGITVADATITDSVSTITGLQARFRADTVNGVADGTVTQYWGDSSGNGYGAVIGNTTNAPTYVAGALNGQPVLRFSNNQYLRSSMPSITTASTVVVVMKYQTSAGNQTFFSGSAGGTYSLCYIPNGKLEIVKSVTAVVAVNNTAYAANTYTAAVAAYDPSGPYGFTINGTSGSSGSSASTFVPSPATYIGTNGAVFAENLTGDIAEILVWNRVLGSYEISLVDTYINGRYGISITDKITQVASENFTGADADSWPAQWTGSSSFPNATLAIRSNQGLLVQPGGSPAYAKEYLNSIAPFTNGGISLSFYSQYIQSFYNGTLNVMLSTDGTGTANDTTNYCLAISVLNGVINGVNVFKYVGGAQSLNMTYIGLSYSPGPVMIRFERIGTVLRFKIWPQGQIEPSAWMAVLTDTSGSPLGSGSVTIANRANSSNGFLAYISNINVYTIG